MKQETHQQAPSKREDPKEKGRGERYSGERQRNTVAHRTLTSGCSNPGQLWGFEGPFLGTGDGRNRLGEGGG